MSANIIFSLGFLYGFFSLWSTTFEKWCITIKKIPNFLFNSFRTKGLISFLVLFSSVVCTAKSPLSNVPVLSEKENLQHLQNMEVSSSQICYVQIINWCMDHPKIFAFCIMLIVAFVIYRFDLIMKLFHFLLSYFSRPLRFIFERLPLSYRRGFRKNLKKIRETIDIITLL